MKLSKGALFLLAPSIGLFIVLLVLPIANVTEESFRLFVPGRIGASKDAPYTFFNYAELFEPAYLFYFIETLRLSLISSLVALIIGFPIAYIVARLRDPKLTKLAIGFLIGMMFLSTMVRVYALQLTFGPTGFSKILSSILNTSPNSRFYTELVVIFGFLHYVIPISAITLLGTIKNLNPRMAEAAQTLGSPRWKVHLTITIPLCIPGILSAFLISYTLCMSGFVVPMILGKGKVLFISNLIYSRFSEIANYPSGSAIAVAMLLLSLGIIYGITFVANRMYKG
jgi:putative spermidine/putrescine transport system permease protein